MAILALKVLDKDSNTICVSSGENFVDLVCTHTYEEGDRIVLETDEKIFTYIYRWMMHWEMPSYT